MYATNDQLRDPKSEGLDEQRLLDPLESVSLMVPSWGSRHLLKGIQALNIHLHHRVSLITNAFSKAKSALVAISAKHIKVMP